MQNLWLIQKVDWPKNSEKIKINPQIWPEYCETCWKRPTHQIFKEIYEFFFLESPLSLVWLITKAEFIGEIFISKRKITNMIDSRLILNLNWQILCMRKNWLRDSKELELQWCHYIQVSKHISNGSTQSTQSTSVGTSAFFN